MQLSVELGIPKNCVYNAMHYVDKYVGIVSVQRSNYQTVGVCCLFVSSKLEAGSHPSLEVFLEALENSITRSTFIELEQ